MIHSFLQARKLLLILICLELLLVLTYGTIAWVQGTPRELYDLFDLNGEGNLPAWFSSLQLALVAIGFWALAARRRATQRPSRSFLQASGGFFLLLSIDEAAMLHERITHAAGSRYIDWVPAYAANHIGETFVCVIVLLGCIVFAYPHIRGLCLISSKATLIFAAGCGVYLIGAAVLETIGYEVLCKSTANFFCLAEIATEEFFEMLGASLILHSVLLLCCMARKTRGRKTTVA
jgi:hypothetical protein